MRHADTTTATAMARATQALDWAKRRRWLLTGLVALACAWLVSARVGSADRARHAWGTSRSVAIASHDLVPGMVVTEGDVTIESRPIAVLPDDALDSPMGRVVVDSIAAGEAVLDRRLIGGQRRMPGALADGSVFAVPIDRSAPALSVGDRVDVWAQTSSRSTSATSATRAARRARVIAVADRMISISVSTADADTTARAILDGSVIIALSPVDE